MKIARESQSLTLWDFNLPKWIEVIAIARWKESQLWHIDADSRIPTSRALIFSNLGKLPTYPSPNLTFCPKKKFIVNIRLGEGKVGSFPITTIDPQNRFPSLVKHYSFWPWFLVFLDSLKTKKKKDFSFEDPKNFYKRKNARDCDSVSNFAPYVISM